LAQGVVPAGEIAYLNEAFYLESGTEYLSQVVELLDFFGGLQAGVANLEFVGVFYFPEEFPCDAQRQEDRYNNDYFLQFRHDRDEISSQCYGIENLCLPLTVLSVLTVVVCRCLPLTQEFADAFYLFRDKYPRSFFVVGVHGHNLLAYG